MSDESFCITPCNEEKITEEQRARMSQNFRAAKALLARKRRRDYNIETQGNGTKRVPLQEISFNTPALASKNVSNSIEHGSSCRFEGMFTENNVFSDGYLSSTKVRVSTRLENAHAFEMEYPAQAESSYSVPPVDETGNTAAFSSKNMLRLVEGKLNTVSSFRVVPANEDNSNNDGSGANKIDVSTENKYAADSFKTPVKRLESSGYDNSFSMPSISDDDLDGSILGDIDILCEQQSIAKVGGDGDNNNFLEKFQQGGDRRANCTVSFETILDNENQNPEYTLHSGHLSESEPNGPSIHQTQARCESLKIEFQMDPEGASDLMINRSNPMPESGRMFEEYSKYLQSLDDRQREAACSDISVPLLIAAGPGSGKTSTMVGRILMLLHEGISPSNILAMTFTTAAVSEMRDRIGSVAGKAAAKELTISTFHSFSLQLCRLYAEKLERTQEFLIYGHGQQKRAVIEAVRLLENHKNRQSHGICKAGEDLNDMNSPLYFKDKSKKWQKFVTQAKASGRTPEEYDTNGDEIGAAILRNYGDILQSCNALDYHDLISCAVKLLSDFPEVFKESQDLWKAIVIDEFQDTSAMQYRLLRILASHNCVTIIGDDDQSIFSFNGADISGFDSFRRDFPNYKEVRLNKNYRSTYCIVEAASYLIQNNTKRCQFKSTFTDNSFGAKITIKECHNEGAQCSFVVDKILEATSTVSSEKSSYGSIAILYRRQVSGKVFQIAFRDRKIPFNLHGVAFYRKKAVKAIIAMLRTALPGCDDGPYRQVFKALLPFDKEEKKKVIAHIDKVLTTRKCSFISAAGDIFSAKISGTFKRSQLTQGRKVLSTLDIISKLVHREQSLSAVITSVANMVPQKYLLEQRAVFDVDGGKLLNEDHDLRSVLQYLLDDVSDFLSTQYVATEGERDDTAKTSGCVAILEAFIDYITERERENFRSRRYDNDNSVTLTTIHQSKGLEWDIVFIVKANESEIPLLHEYNGVTKESTNSIEEERRLFYVAMTRARKKLFIIYMTMDTNWQMLLPSRFLKEIPDHLREVQAEIAIQNFESKPLEASKGTPLQVNIQKDKQLSEEDNVKNDIFSNQSEEALGKSTEPAYLSNGTSFLRRFSVEERNVVSQLFHQWAKKQAFQDPKRLLGKVGFVTDERLRDKRNKHKDILRALKSSLGCEEAFQYAEYVLRWLKIPADERAHIMREKQEHFQKLRVENSMGLSAPTSKQISYLQNLGCTIVPTSRLHASRLIEQYKSL